MRINLLFVFWTPFSRNIFPPTQAPNIAPAWWDKKTIPPNVARYLGPINVNIIPFVRGIVASHNKPIEAPKRRAVVGDAGRMTNNIITIDLPK